MISGFNLILNLKTSHFSYSKMLKCQHNLLAFFIYKDNYFMLISIKHEKKKDL